MHNPSRRHFLKESERKQVLEGLRTMLGVEPESLLGSKPQIEVVETQDTKEIFIYDKIPFSAKIGNALFPTLLFSKLLPLLPKIVVDMGAVPHVCNGADVMAPGVVKIDGEFGNDAFLLIVDERHGKPLAIGRALMDSEVMKKTKHGKIVKNVHYVGDELWSLMRKLA